MSNSQKIPPRLTEEQMQALAIKTVQDYINACNCKSCDDILLALSIWLNTGLSAAEAVQHDNAVTVQ